MMKTTIDESTGDWCRREDNSTTQGVEVIARHSSERCSSVGLAKRLKIALHNCQLSLDDRMT